MAPTLTNLSQTIAGVSPADLGKALLMVLLGFGVAKIASAGILKAMSKLGSNYQTKLIRRIVFYLIFILFVLAALQHLGFKLNVLLGAAGILTVSLGFASQTSASNIISGLFLIAEKPFVVGDSIIVGDTSGQVISIDLLSVKIRTNDNTLIRVPNETLIKSNVTNLTRFRIRRYDLQFGISYQEDIEKVRGVLLAMADKNPFCLKDPAPALYFSNFGASTVNLQFSVWATRANFSEMKNKIPEEVKIALAENKIDMPFPQLTINVETPK